MSDWDEIVRENVPMALEAAWRVLGVVEDSEDAVQSALVDALKVSRRQQVRCWPALLRRLTVCRALDLLRTRKRGVRLDFDLPCPRTDAPERVAVEMELRERLRRALTELSPREAEVFSLRYLAELSNTEIATELEMTPSAVGVALHKARTRLENLLKEDRT